MEIKILGIVSPILFGLLMFIIRHMYKLISDLKIELKRLDHRMREGVTEPEVRQILADKLLPIDIKTSYISDDIIEMKHNLDKFLDKYIMK